jgi:cell division protein FtsI (penicillin-binding protein 3)/stage V sporulation protein D (sporulation-specific penicillin-binding protein)
MSDVRHQAPHIQIPPRRVAFLLVGLLVALAAVGTRTLWLQTVRNDSLDYQAKKQQVEQRTLPAVRGDIVDRDGRALAIGEEAVTFAGDPTLIKDPVSTAVQVSRALAMTKTQEEDLIARMTNAKGHFVYIARQVSRDKAQVLQKLSLKGVYSYDEEKRMYPNGNIAGQLLGAVDIDGRGIDGLELLYDKSLSGTPGMQVVVRDPAGVPIDVKKLRRERDGHNVQLTIDLRIQAEAERVLASTVKRIGAQSASAIVLNPNTGEILAMANVPRANPGKWNLTPAASRRNRIVTDTYEPGSVFKVVTISGAIEDGKVTPSTRYTLPNELRFCNEKDTCRLHDAETRGTVNMNVKQILVESSNIGTVTIAQRALHKEGVHRWLRQFGFDALTGIDFPGEVPGRSLEPKDWNAATIGSIPIGQSISVTPIQVASAYAAIANDGVLVRPHVLTQIGGEADAAHTSRRVLSAATARTMRSMFNGVVKDEGGTGTRATIPGYKVGGKTGTANFVDPATGQYVKKIYNSSFVGFVPVENPQLVTLVVVNHTSMFGGDAAAPAFQQITESALRTLAIPPT